ncbi:phage portal protein [[Clostridium] polysaccharolyticum]|uniref:Phage portal protein, SPP1 family n=1 Tax=[Clostridium] polysaccharolyticum TaxID=29364 RepID=A0A1H9YIW4_9FIRM|nr:phage portal protein [[Clostridium] polysaccharolyticum]SES68883.1 phage portal protein, SPP1 family [[Clostridium] polysaccharolyticum]
MDLDVIKKLIKKYESGHMDFVNAAMTAERYYRNETDVLFQKKKEDEDGNPLRNADNRIPRNFHGLIVNQKASYAFTAPPIFDVGNTAANKTVAECLGDEYAKNCMELCINASNASIAWVHYWQGDEGFEWAVVDSKQIIPVWSKKLKKTLVGVLRVYNEIDETDSASYTVYEYWSETECQAFKRINELDTLEFYNMFSDSADNSDTSEYKHNLGRVPFIPFMNNNIGTNDLKNIKHLIDVYDKVYSGFINDLDDIQELIFILSGYGGTELSDFLKDLKKYKTIKVDGDEENAGVSTLSIEIPIEARKTILEATRKAIFEQGQGFDPQPESFGNQSGEALKFMYSLLEMKVGLMQTEFQLGFAELVRAICKYKGIECKTIIQTWTRTCIKNDTEQAQICKDSVGIVSKRTILKNHPLVEDADKELEYLKQEEEEQEKKFDPYNGNVPPKQEDVE